jgi:hypothetical protein
LGRVWHSGLRFGMVGAGMFAMWRTFHGFRNIEALCVFEEVLAIACGIGTAPTH